VNSRFIFLKQTFLSIFACIILKRIAKKKKKTLIEEISLSSLYNFFFFFNEFHLLIIDCTTKPGHRNQK
jgi:hypothetical protein